MFSETRCQADRGCTRCLDRCPHQALTISDGKVTLAHAHCRVCKELSCTDSCYQEALKRCGKRMTVGQLLQRLEDDRDFWGENGGVTFSGGDPFAQHNFLETLAQRCQKLGIHTAIETAAFIRTDIFLQVMQCIDFAFVDVKHMDSQRHHQCTGVENELILHNIQTLLRSSWSGRLVLRGPVIAGFNDDEENMQKLAAFMKQAGAQEINLLPFHRLGESKWQQTGKDYPVREWHAPDEQKMAGLAALFSGRGLRCYVGSETPF
ncbi:glycyl-radical enzyme activating protein [Dryocola clanedunensis]|uniref:glycyl-radical enzyme activating protein n=1 Tax=Cedecea sulfonylureivorans TaxID=3051154 RepID=UPI0019270D36|nr:glycyl-radical enzyme activating protein [Cedecea sulfonylureivorans]